jgi:non-specific serine/threonine protein kinase
MAPESREAREVSVEDSSRTSSRGRRRRPGSNGNITRDLTTFVGREHELRELQSLVGRSRLVTLLGPGGIGKSRLARELGGRLTGVFPGGVWLVELADVTNVDRLPSQIARALGVVESRSIPLEDQLARAIRARALVILDNCEHVVEACARLTSSLLAASAELRVLATSREPLEINGEKVFLVEPLPVPESVEEMTAGEYLGFAGLQLFVDRLVSRDRTFRLTDEHLRLIASVCSGVGGMPLAIELAASRAALVPLTTLNDQMGGQLGFENLRRDVPDRHRTMRSALAWSYEALSEPERELWKRLAVFSGGATLPAIRAVCAYGALTTDVLDEAVMGLVERSIVSLDSGTSEGRYRMLMPVRLFGLEQTRRDDEESHLRRAHLDWCLQLIPGNAWVDGTDQLHWMRTSEREHSNIAAALDYGLAGDEDLERGLQLFTATFLFWGVRGWYREVRHYAEAFLARGHLRPAARSQLLFMAGMAAWYTYDLDTASERFTEGARNARRSVRARGLAYYGLGTCALARQAYTEAARLLEAACELLEASDMNTFLASARYQLSQVYLLRPQAPEGVRAVLEPNLELTSQGDFWNHAMTRAQLGALAWREGAFDEAESHLVKAVELQEEVGHLFGLAASLSTLAWVAVATGEHERAAHLFGAADNLFARLGTTLLPGLIPAHEEARARCRKALGAERFSQHRLQGSRLPLAQAVKLARREVGAAAGDDARELTTRELEVAELVAQGATNAQISFELMIALETVKTHVRSILRKLGFDSRVQIAGWLRTQHPGQGR